MSRTRIFITAANTARFSFLVGLLPFMAGCSGNGDPFSYVKVYGTVTYADGSPIPAQKIMLSFVSETATVIGKAHPRMATSVIDSATGKFHFVTSHTPNDGLLPGKHKVTITDPDHNPLPANIVPAEYADFKKTSLEVDTDHLPFAIKIAKPGANAKANR